MWFCKIKKPFRASQEDWISSSYQSSVRWWWKRNENSHERRWFLWSSWKCKKRVSKVFQRWESSHWEIHHKAQTYWSPSKNVPSALQITNQSFRYLEITMETMCICSKEIAQFREDIKKLLRKHPQISLLSLGRVLVRTIN